MLLGRWFPLLLFTCCLYSGCLLWRFFFFLRRSCWSSLQNSTSSPFLQDSQPAVSGCIPAASIFSQLWWSTVALFLWSYTVYCWIFYVTKSQQFLFWPVNFLILTGCCKYHADIAQISPTLTQEKFRANIEQKDMIVPNKLPVKLLIAKCWPTAHKQLFTEKIICNFVWIYLGQHCFRKLLKFFAKCRPTPGCTDILSQ